MNLYKTVFLLMLYVTFLSCFHSGLTRLNGLSELEIQRRKETESLVFIAESFKKTVQLQGFDSLDNWQQSCREMWQLDDISYSIQNCFFYASWSGKYGKGEVYEKADYGK